VTPALTVFRKEVRESLRDRRALLNSLLVGPLIAPLLFVGMVRFVVSDAIEKGERLLPVAVIGAERAPNLVEALRHEGMLVRPPVEDVEEAVRSQRVDLALRISPEFAEDWRAGRPAQVEVFFDSSRRDVGSDVGRLESMLGTVSRKIGILRLQSRGISPVAISPVLVAARDQATPRARGAMVFSMLPYFLAMTLLLGGMWLAIDTTSGERERQSIEPLLVNPVRRAQIVAGKLAATAAFSFASLLLSLVVFRATTGLLPREAPEFALAITPGFLAGAMLVMIPVGLLLAPLQMLLASFARTFREAQTYVGLLQIAMMIPSAVLMMPFKEQPALFVVPFLGQQLTLLRMLRGEPVPVASLAACSLLTLAAAWGLYRLTVRVFEGERFAFPSA
jgi:sodium transport system permease protein